MKAEGKKKPVETKLEKEKLKVVSLLACGLLETAEQMVTENISQWVHV